MRDMREIREVPTCLNRRYQTLDNLIKDLSVQDGESGSPGRSYCTDPSIRLMCDFWNILKDSPNCDLPAQSYDKQCNARLKDLLLTEKKLQEQIQILEQREKDGAQMLRQADCMWACMEETYKKKIEDYIGRQKDLLTQLKEVETSTTKWKKNKKELEAQITNIFKCQDEIKQKISQKTNDMKFIKKEIEDFKKRIDSNKKDIASTQNVLTKKKEVSDTKIFAIGEKVRELQNGVKAEKERKREKEQEGTKYIKEAREDLQRMCRVLLQKKLENEDLTLERDALIEEINVLKDTCALCKDRCQTKQKSIAEQIKKVTAEIKEFKLKCVYCHECTDTDDSRKFCLDCPKCLDERNCITADDTCSPDHTLDCVCQAVKCKFLDNVFDNMYTVLEKQANTAPGKAVAEAVISCLKKSKNGKLNEETRSILQNFILTTVKKNLNLTIVGGAVKTRCEMDPETYTQLMTCLNRVEVSKKLKTDVATAVKKDSCRRWGGPSECNCPKGPNECICTKKAPPSRGKSDPCPKNKDDENEAKGFKITCPHADNKPCGPDCGLRQPETLVGKQAASWKPDPCKGPTCNFQNMRAAQCVLGPEPLASYKNKKRNATNIAVLADQITCKCGSEPTKPCYCEDRKTRPRHSKIEEVMGQLLEVSPINKVTMSGTESNRERKIMHLNASNYEDSQFSSKSTHEPVLAFTSSSELCLTCMLSKDEIKLSSNALETALSKRSRSHVIRDIEVIYRDYEDESSESIPIETPCSQQNECEIEDDSSDFITNVYDINETVKELLEEIIVSDEMLKVMKKNSNIEWIDSLMKEIMSLTNISQISVKNKKSEIKTKKTVPSNRFDQKDKNPQIKKKKAAPSYTLDARDKTNLVIDVFSDHNPDCDRICGLCRNNIPVTDSKCNKCNIENDENNIICLYNTFRIKRTGKSRKILRRN